MDECQEHANDLYSCPFESGHFSDLAWSGFFFDPNRPETEIQKRYTPSTDPRYFTANSVRPDPYLFHQVYSVILFCLCPDPL